jgi:uncharacterized protein YprB with RNaseH-like and TPR domain
MHRVYFVFWAAYEGTRKYHFATFRSRHHINPLRRLLKHSGVDIISIRYVLKHSGVDIISIRYVGYWNIQELTSYQSVTQAIATFRSRHHINPLRRLLKHSGVDIISIRYAGYCNIQESTSYQSVTYWNIQESTSYQSVTQAIETFRSWHHINPLRRLLQHSGVDIISIRYVGYWNIQELTSYNPLRRLLKHSGVDIISIRYVLKLKSYVFGWKGHVFERTVIPGQHRKQRRAQTLDVI